MRLLRLLLCRLRLFEGGRVRCNVNARWWECDYCHRRVGERTYAELFARQAARGHR